MPRGSSWISLCAALVAALLSAPGVAAPVPSLDLRRLSTPTDAQAALYLEPVQTPGHLQWNVGARSSYAHRLVVLEDESGRQLAVPVRHQVSVDYVAAFGLTDRLTLGGVFPTVVYQQGDDVGALIDQATELPTAALGDVALAVKAALVPSGSLGGFALGALARVSFPTGNSSSYASESAATGELRLLGELSLVAITLQATGGMLVRGTEQSYAGSQFGHELPWGIGLGFRPQILGVDAAGRWQWNVEFHGALALTPSLGARAQSPAVAGLSARYAVSDVSVLAGAELPLSGAVGAPAVRAMLGLSYAPRFLDADDDGIGDAEDECVELAEDFDGFEDSDGCPDFDNDGDGVPDDLDKCPKDQEDVDGTLDDDGCIDPDNDGDGVLDSKDKCPDEPGPVNVPGSEPGCPMRDGDVDGIADALDRCPAEPEDRDAFEDEDGCLDPDNDRDGAADAEDACPRVAGPLRSDPKLNGCASPDLDGDTWEGQEDRCPQQAEDFDGETDNDGCADAEGKNRPLARWTAAGSGRRLELERPIAFDADAGVLPASDPSLRAIATLLNQSPDFVLLVGVRPPATGVNAEQVALNRSFAIVEALRRYTHRDDAAESIAWAAVRKLPGAERTGIGFLVLAPRPESKPAAATPQAPKKP